MSNKTIPALLALAFQKALADYCDSPNTIKNINRLERVRELQKRSVKHYGVPVLLASRSVL